MVDAFDLCHMIVDRYKDDKLFSQIPKDYYDLKSRVWAKLHFEWEKNGMKRMVSSMIPMMRDSFGLDPAVLDNTNGRNLGRRLISKVF